MEKLVYEKPSVSVTVITEDLLANTSVCCFEQCPDGGCPNNTPK